MPKSYRLRTQLGVDQTLQLNVEQDFDFLEILSMKLTQGDAYTRFCADYGVVVGRVVANGGFGVPNVRVSIFVPVDDEDLLNPVISTLYPYKSPAGLKENSPMFDRSKSMVSVCIPNGTPTIMKSPDSFVLTVYL